MDDSRDRTSPGDRRSSRRRRLRFGGHRRRLDRDRGSRWRTASSPTATPVDSTRPSRAARSPASDRPSSAPPPRRSEFNDVRFLGYPDGAARGDPGAAPRPLAGDPPGHGRSAWCASHPSATGPASSPPILTICGPARRPCARSIPTRVTPSPTPSCSPRDSPEWTVSEIWINAAPDHLLNHYVDVTDTFDRKVAALRAHVSQTEHVDLDTLLRGWLGAQAAAGGLGTGPARRGVSRGRPPDPDRRSITPPATV